MNSRKILSSAAAFFFIFTCGEAGLKASEAHKALNEQEKKIFRGLFKRNNSESAEYVKQNLPASFPPGLAETAVSGKSDKDRNRALEILELYPAEQVINEWLKILIESASFETKIRAMEILSPFNDRNLVMPLAQELSSPFYPVRKSAAQALVKSKDDRIYPFILSMADDENPAIRIRALEAMNYLYDWRFYNFITSMLEDRNKTVRIYALTTIYNNNLQDALPGIRKLISEDIDNDVIISAVRIAGDFSDKKSLPLFSKLVSHENRDVRLESVKSLKKIAQPRSTYTLSASLAGETDDEVKEQILDVLIYLKKIDVTDGIANILLKDNNFRLRAMGAFALGYAPETRFLDLLSAAINDENYRVRGEVCRSLGEYPVQRSISLLLEVIKNDSSRYVRSAALYALKKINDKKAVPALFEIYSTEQEPVFKLILEENIRYYLETFL